MQIISLDLQFACIKSHDLTLSHFKYGDTYKHASTKDLTNLNLKFVNLSFTGGHFKYSTKIEILVINDFRNLIKELIYV